VKTSGWREVEEAIESIRSCSLSAIITMPLSPRKWHNHPNTRAAQPQPGVHAQQAEVGPAEAVQGAEAGKALPHPLTLIGDSPSRRTRSAAAAYAAALLSHNQHKSGKEQEGGQEQGEQGHFMDIMKESIHSSATPRVPRRSIKVFTKKTFYLDLKTRSVSNAKIKQMVGDIQALGGVSQEERT